MAAKVREVPLARFDRELSLAGFRSLCALLSAPSFSVSEPLLMILKGSFHLCGCLEARRHLLCRLCVDLRNPGPSRTEGAHALGCSEEPRCS